MPGLDFYKSYVLEDENVRLQPLGVEHIEYLAELADDPAIRQYILELEPGEDSLNRYVWSALSSRAAATAYAFAVYDKRAREYAGTTRYYDYNREFQTIKLGHTWYGRSFRGTGLNKRCKYLLFEFAFEILEVQRIGFGVHAENYISLAALRRIGCQEEGRLKQFFPADEKSERADCVLLSVLRDDWLKHIKSDLKYKLENTTL